MKQIFSFAIFKDTFKRIMTLSIVLTVVLTVVSAVSVFFNSWIVGGLFGDILESNVLTYSFFDYSPLIVTFATLGVPILVLIANSYMTRRADSDFYDALPHTRTAMAVSSMTALLATSAAITVISFGISLGFSLIFVKDIVIPWGSNILKLLSLVLIEWLAIAVFSLSSAITGTTFNALAVGFLIIEGPRAVMTVINDTIIESSPVIALDSAIPLFDNNYNLYTAIGASNYTPISSPGAYVYTVIIAIGYTALAIFAFNKRKSESATHSAPSAVAQHVYRISVSTLVSVLGIYLLFTWGFDLLSVIVLVFSVIVYFVYELLTTKRAKNLLGALATFPIFILLNGIIAATIGISAYFEANYKPAADDVDSISIVLDGEETYVSFDNYVTLMSEKIEITDTEALTIVTDSLRDNVERHEAGTYFGTYVSQGADYHYTTVKIKSGLRTEYRNIYIPTADYMTILEKLAASDGYRELWYMLPENPEVVSAQYSTVSFKEATARELYQMVREEISSLGYDAWVELYSGADYTDASLMLNFNVTANGDTATVYLNVPCELVGVYERAEAALASLMQTKKAEILAALDEFLADDGENLYLSAYVWNDVDVYEAFGYRSEFDATEDGSAEELIVFLKALVTDSFASYDDVTYVEISLTRFDGKIETVDIICKLPEGASIDDIAAMFKKYGYAY